MTAWKLHVFQRRAELSPSASSRGDEKSRGCISNSQSHILQPLSGRFPAGGPSDVFLPPWSTVRRARATLDPGTRRGALTWHRTPNTEPGRAFQLCPRPGEAAPGGLRRRGRGLDSPPLQRAGLRPRGADPESSSRLCASQRSSPGARAPAAQKTESAPRRRSSSPASLHGALILSSRRWFCAESRSAGRESSGPETLPSARATSPRGVLRARWPSPPYLLGGRLLGGLRVQAAHARGSASPRHLGDGAAGRDAGASGPPRRTLSSGPGRPGLGALRSALHVTTAGTAHGGDGPRPPRGRRTSGGRGGLPGSGPFPARPPGRAPEAGAGTRSGRERAAEGPRGTSSGWWRRGLEAPLA